MSERSEQELVRLQKLEALRKEGYPFPNDVTVTHKASDLLKLEDLGTEPDHGRLFSLAGRIVAIRLMGKAAFIHILDGSGKVQVYIRKDEIGDESYSKFKAYDIGDIVEVKGYPFVTKTGEKTLYASGIRLLTKCLIPLPEKWHGLSDVEIRYRQRYLDLISNPDVRETFRTRAKIIRELRAFMDENGFLEVETPVLQSVPGGADARPFTTYHNSLDVEMHLRISLELPLKKLIVGGFERVYEIGRVFRNEGISTKHNPEFTMIEFYMAYATFEDLMDLTERLYARLVGQVSDSGVIRYGEKEIDMNPPWPRMTMVDSIYALGGVGRDIDLTTLDGVRKAADVHGVELAEPDDWGRSLAELWDELVEDKIVNPMFITHHPFSISPLARANLENPSVTDRFELIISGMECANAFSELNDPIDQRQRFEAQAKRKAAGDEEAQDIDEDFLRALEYGMPPTAGEGIGIDRLVMLLTNSQSIREVLLFPQLKPKDSHS
ncbi:MAG: lysine--tRNA ligase [Candidatus Dadabacteria bacterium]|nr:MAG: lysine--tRNA ligase [Candidatus Dadabacteria bacterium]